VRCVKILFSVRPVSNDANDDELDPDDSEVLLVGVVVGFVEVTIVQPVKILHDPSLWQATGAGAPVYPESQVTVRVAPYVEAPAAITYPGWVGDAGQLAGTQPLEADHSPAVQTTDEASPV
jgi:hypothetical protein